MKALLNAGANPASEALSIGNKKGLTPEEVAAKLGHKHIVSILHDFDLSGKTQSMAS